MSGRPWYKRCGADFIEGTMGLSLEEKGAYSLVLDLIYSHGGPIADDPRWLAGVCNVSTRKWKSIRDRLVAAGKIAVEEGRISNARAIKELVSAKLSSENLAESGAKGGRKAAENRAGANKNNGLSLAGLKQEREDKSREEDISLRERSAPTDVRRTLWDVGVKTVQAMAGLPESKAKGLVGKWLKQAGDDASKVLAKIRQAEADRVDIVPWVTKALQPSPRNWRDEPEYRGVQ